MYSLRIPGHLEGLTRTPDPEGTKEQIARQLLFPESERDVHGIGRLPKDADCILEQTEVIAVGKESRREVTQVGRWTVSQLLPSGLSPWGLF